MTSKQAHIGTILSIVVIVILIVFPLAFLGLMALVSLGLIYGSIYLAFMDIFNDI